MGISVHIRILQLLARLHIHSPLAVGLVRRPVRHLAILGTEEYFFAIRALFESCAPSQTAWIGTMHPSLEVCGLLGRRSIEFRDVHCRAKVAGACLDQPFDDVRVLQD